MPTLSSVPEESKFYKPDDIDDLVVWTFPCADCGEVGCPYMYGDDRKELETRVRALINQQIKSVLDELDKSMPTAEQLTTKYGYHMPEKQYGYKLALHDIREVLTKLEAEL